MGNVVEDLAVIVASASRPQVLHETVAGLLRQSAPPAETILSVPAEGEHILAATEALPRVRVVRGEAGLTRQRNRAVAGLGGAIGIVTFLDDDVELRDDYLAAVVRAFRADPDIVFVTGHVVADGMRAGTAQREAARALLDEDARRHGGADAPLALAPITCRDAYGCNMSARRRVFGRARFDERLPLYGLMEDLDFAQQCARLGRIARCDNARMVHLFVASGRLPGARLGFAQIINPIYLWRKGSVPTSYLVRELARPVIANLLKLARPSERADRRARLAGNGMALAALMRGRVVPEDMLAIPPTDRAAPQRKISTRRSAAPQ